MVTKATKTLDIIDLKIVDNNDNNHRTHLGASLLGHSCSRYLWYIFRWAQKAKFPAQTLRLFDQGHLEEPRFVNWLKQAGIHVWEFDNTGKQYKINDCGGHFGGSMDGIALGIPDLPLDAYVLLEFKTHNLKSFTALQKEGVKNSKPQHYVQMQVYMRKQGLRYGLYMAINKNNDALYLEIVHLDEAYADTFLARANRVIVATEAPPRLKDNPTWYECKWCDFAAICHHGKPAEVNCRTCKNCTPVASKQWHCKLGNDVNEYLHTGCSNHRYFKDMVGGYQQSATEDSNNVKKRLLQNGIFT